jgi:5-(carboxyamino)imidazole ribonucleotide synthase
MNQNILNTKIGILGGGQLGRMLCLAAADWNLDISVLDSAGCPSQDFCKSFVDGDIKVYENVLEFGKGVDIITIEIEHVNLEALKELKRLGKKVYPDPEILETINDKNLQKQFYQSHNIATSDFQHFHNKESILNLLTKNNSIDETTVSPHAANESSLKFPFVQKSCKDGYDGKGVVVIKDKNELTKLLDCPSIIESLVDIDKELAVIVARNSDGQIKVYPTAEMEFDHDSNLVKFLFTPANIDQNVENRCKNIALDIVKKLDFVGLLAVELFLTQSGEILVNEIAPRAHNSGHHTIEGSITSQFEQHLRAILNLELGEVKFPRPAAMVNLIGEVGFNGKVKIQGLNECLRIPEFHLHLYGKKETRANRKMGHATVQGQNFDEIKEKADTIIKNLKIISE